MRSQIVNTPYGQVHAKIAGRGDVALFLHGRDPAVNGWRAWEANLQPVADAGFRAVECVMEALDRLSLLRVSLVGNSWGGMIAWKIALLAPRRVDRLALVAAAGAPQLRDKFPGEIACPTLIVWAEEDPIIPASDAQLFAEAIPNAVVRVLSVAAEEAKGKEIHPLAKHHPQRLGEAFNNLLIEFLRG